MPFLIVMTHLLYQAEFLYSNISSRWNDALYHILKGTQHYEEDLFSYS